MGNTVNSIDYDIESAYLHKVKVSSRNITNISSCRVYPMHSVDTSAIKQIPILDVARRLDVDVRGRKAMCFSGHDNKTPSLSFNVTNNTWKCFGACGKYGDGITLVQEVLKLDFKEAAAWFQQQFRVGIGFPHGSYSRPKLNVHQELPPGRGESEQDRDKPFHKDAELYRWLIEKCGQVSDRRGLNYLAEHGISGPIASKHRVRELHDPRAAIEQLVNQWGKERVYRSGLAWGTPSHIDRLIWSTYSLLFPFYEDDQVIYIQGRVIDNNIKFLGLKGIEKPIYNKSRLNTINFGDRIHLCEGVPDALALESNRLPAVAILGATSFRKEWVDYFLNYDIYVVPDGDEGGGSFWDKTSSAFMKRGKHIQRVNLPNGKDAADVLATLGK